MLADAWVLAAGLPTQGTGAAERTASVSVHAASRPEGWCPRTTPASTRIAIDGCNWGADPVRPSGWTGFQAFLGATYDALGVLAPSKPVMIAVIGSTESGGSKAAWIRDALAGIPASFPRIRALVWFDWDTDGMDWTIESSAASRLAFAAGIASPDYLAGEAASGPPDIG